MRTTASFDLFPDVPSERAIARARWLAQNGRVGDAERESREDFRHLPIVTIDGETARDFDDAVYVQRQPDGG